MAFSTTCPPDPDSRTQISGFTGIGSPTRAPGSGMALSALNGLALNTNQGAGSIGPVVGALRPQLEIGFVGFGVQSAVCEAKQQQRQRTTGCYPGQVAYEADGARLAAK